MKKYKFNYDANIGNVLFIVEGEDTEFKLIEILFTKILGYQLVKKVRMRSGYLTEGKNSNRRIFALNYSKNQLNKMDRAELDEIYKDFRNNYGFDPSQAYVYLIYDRDVQSYNPYGVDIKDFLEIYSNSASNDVSPENSGYEGLLLLSYPSLESYCTSCFVENCHSEEYRLKLGKELKAFNGEKGRCYQWNKLYNGKHTFRKEWSIIAAEEMDKALISLGILTYNIDDFHDTNIDIFNRQEKIYEACGKFSLISLFSIVLMQLGIIEEETEIDVSAPRKL